jgi:VanZ family protein
MSYFSDWLRRWGPSAVMMIVIFGASSTPGQDIPGFGGWDFLVKKGGHLAGYAMLGMSYLHGICGGKRARGRLMLLSLVLAALYAVTDEFHQSYTPDRTPSPIDVGIDTLGSALGIGILSRIRHRKQEL